MDQTALIQAAEKHADLYEGDDRPDIVTDVLNAFYRGAAWGYKHAQSALDAKQAVIDRLMLEYCPDEMTPEQIREWERHQVASTEKF